MSTSQMSPRFLEGDLFYTFSDGEYHFFKLLKDDTATQTYHVLAYERVKQLPEDESELEITTYHAPIYSAGFENPQLFGSSTLSYDEMIGYYEYLKQTGSYEAIAEAANMYFNKAYELTDLKEHEQAIDNYSHAIDLAPVYYEAIDNRAFCKMDLARWEDAIEDFRLSLSINPLGFLAEFSIGECYFRLKNFENAVVQFEKARAIDPTHPLPTEWLEKTKAQNS